MWHPALSILLSTFPFPPEAEKPVSAVFVGMFVLVIGVIVAAKGGGCFGGVLALAGVVMIVAGFVQLCRVDPGSVCTLIGMGGLLVLALLVIVGLCKG